MFAWLFLAGRARRREGDSKERGGSRREGARRRDGGSQGSASARERPHGGRPQLPQRAEAPRGGRKHWLAHLGKATLKGPRRETKKTRDCEVTLKFQLLKTAAPQPPSHGHTVPHCTHTGAGLQGPPTPLCCTPCCVGTQRRNDGPVPALRRPMGKERTRRWRAGVKLCPGCG